MEQSLMNLFIFAGMCLLVYLIFRNLNMNNVNYKEGMTTDTTSTTTTTATTATNGIAGSAAAYAAQIKAQAIQIEDQLLISKYRADYETVILNLDELVNSLMLQTALNVSQTNPERSLVDLSNLQQAQIALNSVMKYIDASK
jgi:hypothetical protein